MSIKASAEKPLEKLLIGIILICLSALCASLGQLFWKLAQINNAALMLYVIGFVLYGLGSVLMIASFRFGDLSVLHPMLSIGYVLAIIWAHVILSENITLNKVAGIGLIIAGIVLLGQSRAGSRADAN